MLVFSTQLCDLFSLYPSLWFNSPPFPCVNKYTVYTYTVCNGGGGYEILGFKHLPESPLDV
jgi:hypothetical protein